MRVILRRIRSFVPAKLRDGIPRVAEEGMMRGREHLVCTLMVSFNRPMTGCVQISHEAQVIGQ